MKHNPASSLRWHSSPHAACPNWLDDSVWQNLHVVIVPLRDNFCMESRHCMTNTTRLSLEQAHSRTSDIPCHVPCAHIPCRMQGARKLPRRHHRFHRMHIYSCRTPWIILELRRSIATVTPRRPNVLPVSAALSTFPVLISAITFLSTFCVHHAIIEYHLSTIPAVSHAEPPG